MSARPWGESEKDLIRKLAADHKSSSYIAKELNETFNTERTRNSVIGICYRTGIQLQRTPADNLARTNPKIHREKIREKKPKKIPIARAAIPEKIAPPLKVKQKIVSELKEDHIVDETKLIPVLQLRPNTCHFPVKEVSRSKWLFCGETINPGEIYCKHHASKCYQPKKPR